MSKSTESSTDKNATVYSSVTIESQDQIADDDSLVSRTMASSINDTSIGTDIDTHIAIELERLPQRRVHFNDDPSEVVCYLPELEELSEDDKYAMWWSHYDYEEIAMTARTICKEVRRHGALTNGLDEAYQRAIKASKLIAEAHFDETAIQLLQDAVS